MYIDLANSYTVVFKVQSCKQVWVSVTAAENFVGRSSTKSTSRQSRSSHCLLRYTNTLSLNLRSDGAELDLVGGHELGTNAGPAYAQREGRENEIVSQAHKEPRFTERRKAVLNPWLLLTKPSACPRNHGRMSSCSFLRAACTGCGKRGHPGRVWQEMGARSRLRGSNSKRMTPTQTRMSVADLHLPGGIVLETHSSYTEFMSARYAMSSTHACPTPAQIRRRCGGCSDHEDMRGGTRQHFFHARKEREVSSDWHRLGACVIGLGQDGPGELAEGFRADLHRQDMMLVRFRKSQNAVELIESILEKWGHGVRFGPLAPKRGHVAVRCK